MRYIAVQVLLEALVTRGCQQYCCLDIPTDCSDIKNQGENVSKVYQVYPNGMRTGYDVYCDMDTDEGGWLVFQRRQDGSQNFYRNWDFYENGFGSRSGEHWLGFVPLRRILAQGFYELRVDLEDWNGEKRYAKYSVFNIGNSWTGYRLEVLGYSGDAGDALQSLNGQLFSTKNKDNDSRATVNCAVTRYGAWWYNACGPSNLNGRYYSQEKESGDTIHWTTWLVNGETSNRSLKKVEMKIRKGVPEPLCCPRPPPRDCDDIKSDGDTESKVYTVYPKGMSTGYDVYCDMDTDEGGWLVIQRRQDGCENFYRTWDEYEQGFGDKTSEHWLGFIALRRILGNGQYQLRVDLEDCGNRKRYAKYSSFNVGNSWTNYRLEAIGYSGNAGNGLQSHNGLPFSTKNRDNDEAKEKDCAKDHHGAWWYKSCRMSNLNGKYYDGCPDKLDGIHWRP